MSRILSGCLALISILTLACSSEPINNQPTDAGTQKPTEYCDVYRIACERQAECGVGIVNNAKNADACEELANCEAVLADALASGQAVRQADVKSCADTLKSATCEELGNKRLEVDDACFTIHAGTKKENEACTGTMLSDCEPGLVCDTSSTCPGVCRPPTKACVEDSCPNGQYCSFDGACKPKVAANGACEFAGPEAYTENSCVDGYYCDGAEGEEMTCQERLARDSSCTGASWTECAEGLACVNSVCTDPVQKDGECSTMNDCAAGLFCDFSVGTCQPRGAKGTACSFSIGSCGSGLRCRAQGGECGSDLDCEFGSRCCAGANGSVCSTDAVCEPAGICVEADGTVPDAEFIQRPIAESGGNCDAAVCPIGEVCRCENEACETKVCQTGAKLGQDCSEGSNAAFDPFTCSEGMCDVLGSKKCVMPKAVGESCSYAAPTLTYECLSAFCSGRKCVSAATTACEE